MRYEDFVVQLGPEAGSGTEVRASCSLAGEGKDRLVFAVPPEELERWFPEVVHGGAPPPAMAPGRNLVSAGLDVRAGASPTNAPTLGATLFDAIFRGPVRSLLDRSLAHLDREPDLGLRIKLMLDLSDDVRLRLHRLPWELMYKADTGDFLGLSPRTPIVRYLELPRAVRPFGLPETLRVLAMAPEPAGQPALDLQSERRNLETLERSVRGLDVVFVASPDLGSLRRSLRDREVHVLHLMGHADFDPHTGQGVIYLQRPDGAAEPVAAESLVAVVKDFPTLRLVVLNACNTARAGGSGGASAFSGLAPALMRAGLPAVLAMQLPISDGAAIAFSEAFYERLVAGDPLDAAVAEGRQAIHSRPLRTAEWALPVLFLRASDGAVFGSGEGRRSPEGRAVPRGIELLRVGGYDEAIRQLRNELAGAPGSGLLLVALGVALGRGRSLRRLSYRTAQEMHRHFAAALSTPDARRMAAAALLALKRDYFEANAVREPPPDRDELLTALTGVPLDEANERLLTHLAVSDGTRETLVQAGFPERREL